MSRHTNQIAKRYAAALFQSVPKADVRSVGEEFQTLIKVLEDPKVQGVFMHPRTGTERKQELIRLMGFSPTLENFLLFVVEKGREAWLEQIAQEFELLVLDSEQKTMAEVTSAVTLSDEVLEELEAKLSRLTAKTVLVRTNIDPAIGGGLVIKVDGRVIDGSVRNTLQKLKYRLTAN